MRAWASATGYRFEPEDPRAPTAGQWDAMTPEERARVRDSLPSEIERATPPEGDMHFRAKTRALEALSQFFRRARRRVYLASELPVFYPGEPVFAPDLIAVLEVADHERTGWVVSEEGKGVDLALEITVGGDVKKDFETNVVKLARLGVPEYFAFNRKTGRLVGYRLAGRQGAYTPIVPQQGRWPSVVLGLELAVEERRLRFYAGTAPLLEAQELIDWLGAMADALVEEKEAAEAAALVERERAEGAIALAEEQRARAEEQRALAEEQRARADRLAARLRALGEDPEAG